MDLTVGNFFGLFMPFALLGGVLTLTLFLMHGAIFISLKTTGDIRERARVLAGKIGIVAAVAMALFTVWTAISFGNGIWSWLCAVVATVAMVAALLFNSKGREGWAFIFSALATLVLTASFFVAMWPNVIPSSLDPAWSLSIQDASSSTYTLTIMTVAAAIFTPIVLAYQGWTYWVFRKRISVKNIPDPVDETVST
ncbi:MAG: cytochrome d ubiquinol oxidase subunit II, partial [Propionibacterium sp.]|nr:cytochrome d ubiquinol oxidase subunit II [Propionibacterium sp.]